MPAPAPATTSATTPTPTSPPRFSWDTSPLAECKIRLQELEAIIRQARSTLARREASVPIVHHCWSQSHRALVPASVLATCRDLIPEGRWLFRDDGALDESGQRYSALICSERCYIIYQNAVADLRRQRGR